MASTNLSEITARRESYRERTAPRKATSRVPVSSRSKQPKTKAEWLVKSRQRKQRNRESRFIALPAELRNRIYQFVFMPSPKVELRGAERLGRSRLREPKWRTSTSAIVLVNKQIYEEAIPILYRSCTFAFEPLRQAQWFLRTVRKPDLQNVRRMSLEHTFQTKGPTEEAADKKYKSDYSFAVLCGLLAQHLPNVTSLDLVIAIPKSDLGIIVPYFGIPPNTYNMESLSNIVWIRPLKAFTRLRKLAESGVRLQVHIDIQSVEAFSLFQTRLA